jgi:hypothetical protein
LRTDVGKGFMTMEVSHELVDPKVMVNSTQNEYPDLVIFVNSPAELQFSLEL